MTLSHDFQLQMHFKAIDHLYYYSIIIITMVLVQNVQILLRNSFSFHPHSYYFLNLVFAIPHSEAYRKDL